MGGQMDRGKKLKAAFERSKNAADTILDDPEKMAEMKAGAKNFVEENLNEEALMETAAEGLNKGTDILIDLADGTTKALEGLTAADLTPDKLQSIFEE